MKGSEGEGEGGREGRRSRAHLRLVDVEDDRSSAKRLVRSAPSTDDLYA